MSWPHALSILGQSLHLLRVRLDWNQLVATARPNLDNSPPSFRGRENGVSETGLVTGFLEPGRRR
jgi:hypothetical protein